MPGSERQDDDTQADRALFARVIDLLRDRSADRDQARVEGLAQARMDLEAFQGFHPDSVPALRLLAEVTQHLGDIPATRQYIHRAELLDPWSMEILIISESLYAIESNLPGADPGVLPMLDSELNSGSITTEKLVEKAMGCFQLGQLERAYSLSKLAYRIEPEKGHHLLDVWTAGAALEPDRTRRDLIRLTDEAIQEPYLYLALGSIDNVMGLYGEAAGWLQRGLSIHMEDPYVYAMLLNELAYVLIRQSTGGNQADTTQLRAAVRHARRALERFPDKQANGFIKDTLGLAYLKLNEDDKAERYLREAVAKDPSSIARLHLAIILLRRFATADALAELKHIAAARPSLEAPHAEETAILNRVQTHFSRLENLLNLGGADDIKDALAILEGLA